MSALCGFPATLFDLFLESNVMIVANFENLETHLLCLIAPLHDSHWHICAAVCCPFIYLKYLMRYEPSNCFISAEVPSRVNC